MLANQRRGARRRIALADRLRGSHGYALQDVAEFGAGALLRGLGALRERDREVLLLIAWEGLEPARAAAALECSRATLAVRLHRARRRLASAIELADRDGPTRAMSTEAVR